MNFTTSQYSKYNNRSSDFQRRSDDRPRNDRSFGSNNERPSNERPSNDRPNNERQRPAPFCPVCKKNGRPESEYNSHFIRETSDENSPITCPFILNMECNHCGEKGHLVAKCPYKKCVFCNEPGHTVSRCTAGSREEIDRFLDERHQNYVNREQRRDNIFQQQQYQRQIQQQQPVVAPPTLVDMFADAPSLSKKPVKATETPKVVCYAKVAEIAAPLSQPVYVKPEKKVVNDDDEYDSEDEYIEDNSIASDTSSSEDDNSW
jgi:hypothetical protein